MGADITRRTNEEILGPKEQLVPWWAGEFEVADPRIKSVGLFMAARKIRTLANPEPHRPPYDAELEIATIGISYHDGARIVEELLKPLLPKNIKMQLEHDGDYHRDVLRFYEDERDKKGELQKTLMTILEKI